MENNNKITREEMISQILENSSKMDENTLTREIYKEGLEKIEDLTTEEWDILKNKVVAFLDDDGNGYTAFEIVVEDDEDEDSLLDLCLELTTATDIDLVEVDEDYEMEWYLGDADEEYVHCY